MYIHDVPRAGQPQPQLSQKPTPVNDLKTHLIRILIIMMIVIVLYSNNSLRPSRGQFPEFQIIHDTNN